MDVLTSFYERLINSPSPVEPVLQVRVIEYLARVKAFTLLGQFAARAELSEAAEALIVARDEAPVLAGWASRPGRTHAEIIGRLGGEKRVSTVLPLARMRDLPVEIYHEIAKRSSVKITEALMANPSVPEEIKLSRIVGIVAVLDGRKGWRSNIDVDAIAKESTALRRALAEHSCRPSILLTTLDTESVEIPAVLLASLFERIERFPRDDDDSLGSLLARLSVQDLTAAQLKKLRTVVNSVIKEANNSPWNSGAESQATAKHLLSEKGRTHAAQIRRLAVSTDVEESTNLLRELLGSPKATVRQWSAAVYSAVSVNKVLPPEAVKPYLDEFTGDNEHRLLTTWCARGEVKALAEVALEAWGDPEWLETVKDPRPILKEVVTLARSRGEELPRWLLAHPAVYQEPVTALALLPWQSLHRVNNFPEYGSIDLVDVAKRDLVIDAAQKLIAERMGCDPRKWEVFVTLADEFEGTLPDLLDVIEAITA